MTAESELLYVAEDQIVHQLEEAQHMQLIHEVGQLGHGARIADAPHNATRPSEKTPLIVHAGHDTVVTFGDDVDVSALGYKLQQQAERGALVDRYATTSEIVVEEAKQMIRLAVPFAGAQALEVIPLIAFSVLLGNVSGDRSASVIAASGLSDFFQSMAVVTIADGIGSALETVCSQSYGAKQYRQLCLYTQAGMIALAYCMPIMALLGLNGATLFKLAGQDPALADIAGVFTSVNVLAIPFTVLYYAGRSVLKSQHVGAPLVVIPVAASTIALPLAYALSYYTPLGYVGVLIGLVAASVMKLAMLVPYIMRSPAFSGHLWSGFQWHEAHALMWRLIPLGVSSVLMLTFQSIGLNSVAVLCGYLPNAEQAMATSGIAGALFSMAIVPCMGAFASGCIRVGTALGGGSSRRAAIAGYVGTAITIVVASVSAIAGGVIATPFAHNFTQDRATATAATSLIYRILPTIALLGWMLGVQGVLRACSKQALIANLSFVFLFVIGVPAGLVLAITCGLGAQGLWYGQMIGMAGCSVVTTMLVCRLDWDEAAREAYRNTHVHVDHGQSADGPPVPSHVQNGPATEPPALDELKL